MEEGRHGEAQNENDGGYQRRVVPVSLPVVAAAAAASIVGHGWLL